MIRRIVIVGFLGAGVALWLWLRPTRTAHRATPSMGAAVLPDRPAFDRFQQDVKLDTRTDYTAPSKETK